MSPSPPLEALRVGRLPYLNAHPFHAGWRGPEPAWVMAAPRRLAGLVGRGEVDAALVASRDAHALADRFRPLGDLGIARHGAVESVLLFSRVPATSLAGRRVALTGESRTSRALLRILLRRALGVRDPVYVDDPEAADAWLAIGDTALVARAARAWPRVLDLGEAWAAWTGLPFVYARWVVRRDLPAAAGRALAGALAASLARGVALPAVLPRGVTPAAAANYLAGFVYRLGPPELAGLRRFHEELERHDLHRPLADGRRLGSAA